MIDTILATLMAHLWTMIAMALGVAAHVSKKAITAKQADKTFDLSDYMIGHPHQTFLMVVMSIGAYFQLVSDPETPLTLFGAFMAGVASNSLADLAPGGDRGEK